MTTNGSIDPREAIGQAAEILIRQLAIFTDIDRIEGFGEAAQAEQVVASRSHRMENFPIEAPSWASARTTASSASVSRRSATSS